MSRVTYVSLVPWPEGKLIDLEPEPHLTLLLFGKGDDELARWINATVGYCPGWTDGTLRRVTAKVIGQSVYGRGARVLLLDPEPLDPIRVSLFEWLTEMGVKPDGALGAWSPHITVGRDIPPIPAEQTPEKVMFSGVKIKGLTFEATHGLV